MKKTIKVIFRKIDNEVIAIFPEIKNTYNTLLSYMHIGQHGGCSLFYTDISQPCPQKEYLFLLEELKQIYNDCNLVVRQKQRNGNGNQFQWNVF